MKYIWITKAIENEGALTAYHDGNFFRANMEWRHVDAIFSDPCESFADALASLNSALEDDAADECNL
ncbi:MAG: hypothetical protein NTV52_02930 [Acidobacteria bacterium]|nr:hypothetical protein [Acidobacteriota bacterium]